MVKNLPAIPRRRPSARRLSTLQGSAPVPLGEKYTEEYWKQRLGEDLISPRPARVEALIKEALSELHHGDLRKDT